MPTQQQQNGGGGQVMSEALFPTPSETKLLAKTIKLCQLIMAKAPGRFGSELNWESRFRVLLVALLQVVKALDVVERTIGATDRYLNLVELLSHFTFPQALQLLWDGRWVIIVQRKLLGMRRKKYLYRWRTCTHSRPNQQKTRIQLMNPSTNYKPRRIPLEEEKRKGLNPPSILTRPILKNSQPSLPNPIPPPPLFSSPFKRWRLASRTRRVLGCQATEKALMILKIWKKWTLSKRTYSNYVGEGGEVILGGGESSIDGPIALARYAFKEWRGAGKLQRHRIRDVIHVKRLSFIKWKGQTEVKLGHSKLATLYDGTRRIRKVFCHLMALHTKYSFSKEQAACKDRQVILSKMIEIWKSRHHRLLRLNRALGRWRGKLDVYEQYNFTASHFYQRKLFVKYFQTWSIRSKTTKTLEASGEKLIRRGVTRSVKLMFNVWREMQKWVHRNSEKVRTVRAVRDVRHFLIKWRVWREMCQAANSLYNSNLTRRSLAVWQKHSIMLKSCKALKEDSLQGWRRLLKTRQAVYSFKRDANNNNRLKPMKNVLWEKAIPLTIKSRIFLYWHRRATLQRCAELYEAKKVKMTKAYALKSWRMDANIAFYLRQKPWRIKRRIVRKMKVKREQKLFEQRNLQIKLEDHLKGRSFIIYYRGFERWQQAFQSRKMEEHLCGQNLTYYQHLQRVKIVRGWQLLTALKILLRVTALKQRKETFKGWHQGTQMVVNSRKKRLIARQLTRWRHAYRTSVAQHHINGTNRRKIRLLFVAWRMRCKRQQDSHARSIEFIGTSSLHYFLQKWRTETTVQRYSKSHRKNGSSYRPPPHSQGDNPRSRLLPLSSSTNLPHYQSIRHYHIGSRPQEPLHDTLDTEFMV